MKTKKGAKKPIDRIARVDLSFKGAAGDFEFSPLTAVVGAVKTGKTSLLDGILTAAVPEEVWKAADDALKPNILKVANAIPHGRDGAHVVVDFLSGRMAKWQAVFEGKRTTPTVTQMCPESLLAKFPQAQYANPYVTGPQVLQRAVVQRFISPEEAAAALARAKKKMTADEARHVFPSIEARGSEDIVSAWTTLDALQRAGSSILRDIRGRLERLEEQRNVLGISESEAEGARDELDVLNARVQVLETLGMLASTDGHFVKAHTKFKTPEAIETELADATQARDEFLRTHSNAAAFLRLSASISALANEQVTTEPRHRAVEGGKKAVAAEIKPLVGIAARALTERAAAILPSGHEIGLLPYYGGVEFGLRTKKGGPVKPANALSGFERSLLRMAIPVAWAGPGVKPIIMLDTRDMEADGEGLEEVMSRLSSLVKQRVIAQAIVSLHADRSKRVPKEYTRIQMTKE